MLVAISLMMVAMGLFKPEHSELAIIGFLIIFLLSWTLINNNLEYKTGTSTFEHYQYVNETSGTPKVTENILHNVTITEEDVIEPLADTRMIGIMMVGLAAVSIAIITFNINEGRKER